MMLSMHPFTTPILDHLVGPHFVPADQLLRLSREQPAFTESDHAYTITIAAPGVATKDLNVSIEDSVLKVIGETKTAAHTHFVNWSSRLSQKMTFDMDASHAIHADGLLVVTLPKKAASAVKSASSATHTLIAVATSPQVSTEKAGNEESEGEEVQDSEYTITVAAPGFSASELTIEATEARILKIHGGSKRTGATLARHFRLPKDADTSAAAAYHVDGLLTVSMPAMPKPIPKQIPILSDVQPARKNNLGEEDADTMMVGE